MSEGSAAMKPRVGLVRAGALADIAFHNLHDWNLAIPSKEDAFNVIVEEGARMPRDAYRVLASRFPAL